MKRRVDFSGPMHMGEEIQLPRKIVKKGVPWTFNTDGLRRCTLSKSERTCSTPRLLSRFSTFADRTILGI
ncbi:hypothetical protein K474DRAFT_1666518 [Panus rudis PR-1116 ss-1]|nr:hypothetical protein K474DRAFT_1666518 [Panus rudis PR-1116 ss-1]